MPVATTEDGLPVAWYELAGNGDPLLFAHATGFHGKAFAPLAAALAHRFRSVAFDERGHGDTPTPPDGVFDWQGFALDVRAVLDGAGLDRPFAFGHSAGGAAIVLAELARPGTFRAIYCYEPIIPPDALMANAPAPPGGTTRANPLAAGARRRRDVFPSKDAAYDNYASKPPMATFHPDALRAYVDHGFEAFGDGVRLKCRPESEAKTYEMASRHGAFYRLGELRCPVTIAWGEHTTSLFPGAFQLQVKQLTAGRGERLDGLGHFGPFEAPDVVAASILRAFGE